ncbi:MAG: hypothetical protein IPM67_05235 [Sphingomonadales bacterium]|nr:hypothetical protein [Sphingomonadales bacterium]
MGPIDDQHYIVIPITKAMRKALRGHWKRTGFSTRRVLQAFPPIPNGLTIALVNDWIANRVCVARSRHWDHVIKCWSALPDGEFHRRRFAAKRRGPGRPVDPKGSKRIHLNAAMAVLLRSELDRTAADIEKDIVQARFAPDGLTKRVIYGWLYLEVKTAREDHWLFVTRHLNLMLDHVSDFGVRDHRR